ncbi:MAG: hypothetical protein M3N18_04755 [Actinomycetota bacterium]|nr:hypothetical protein [Actinomycetota bacterium]
MFRRAELLQEVGYERGIDLEALTEVGKELPGQAHEANLYDVDAKYGDVVSVEETLEYLEKVREETGAPR